MAFICAGCSTSLIRLLRTRISPPFPPFPPSSPSSLPLNLLLGPVDEVRGGRQGPARRQGRERTRYQLSTKRVQAFRLDEGHAARVALLL